MEFNEKLAKHMRKRSFKRNRMDRMWENLNTLAGVGSSEKDKVFLALAGETRLISSVLSGVK